MFKGPSSQSILSLSNPVVRVIFNDNMDWLDGPLNIGQIAVATSLGYADFRLDDYQWRDERPNLEAWFAEFNERASMQETFFARPSS